MQESDQQGWDYSTDERLVPSTTTLERHRTSGMFSRYANSWSARRLTDDGYHTCITTPGGNMTEQASTALPNAATIVDHYKALNLDSQLSTRELREMLEEWQLTWVNRASRAGTRGEEARSMLAKVEAALKDFASDDTRDTYDLALRRSPKTETTDAQTDWLGIAWNYYYTGDLGAAGVAARKARELDAKDPMPFVVSAWVELGEGEYRRAKDFADEAYVLDELGTDTVDVQPRSAEVVRVP